MVFITSATCFLLISSYSYFDKADDDLTDVCFKFGEVEVNYCEGVGGLACETYYVFFMLGLLL
jgi:hypothetical protein